MVSLGRKPATMILAFMSITELGHHGSNALREIRHKRLSLQQSLYATHGCLREKSVKLITVNLRTYWIR